MIPLIRRLIHITSILVLTWSMAGCTGLQLLPSPTLTSTLTIVSSATSTWTPTPSATATSTFTPIPSPTRTSTATLEPSATASPLPPAPTSSLAGNSSALTIGNQCRSVVDGLYGLKKELGLPDHFMSEDPFRQETDFNPNQYFQVLTHLSMAPGFQLDYVYFSDELGGLPLVYARKNTAAPYQSYAELLSDYDEEITGERSYGELKHKYDYLEYIRIDQETESYFEFVTLAFLGDQFYLAWHGAYNDAKILCDSSDLGYLKEDMAGFELEFSQEMQDRIAQIDFTPVVLVEDVSVTVRFVTFTKWGGFFENVYVMDISDPMQLLDVQFNPLIEYDCGINF